MIAIVAVEVAIVVTAFTKKGEVEGFIDKQLVNTLDKSKPGDAFYTSWDLLQRNVIVEKAQFRIETKIIIGVVVFCR